MSSNLTAAELTSMRADVATLMPDTCNIMSLSSVADGYGGQTETWGTATAGVACRVDPYRGSEALAGGAIQPFNTYVLTVPYTTTITTAQRVQHGSETYNNTSVDQDKSWPITTRVYLERT